MKKNIEYIILIGGGGHCKSCIDIIEQEGRFSIAGIVDLPKKTGEKILGYEIIASDADIIKLSKTFTNFLITVGQIKSPDLRIKLYNTLIRLNVKLPVIISPNAYVSKHAYINEGSIIMHNAIVNANANVGKNCIVNSKALIEHDAVIGDHCHISTGSIINGGVIVGAKSFIGSGAVCKEYITIPENSFIKANSIIF